MLLVIDPGRLDAEVRYEDVPGAELPFPHIYGPLNTGAVLAAVPFAPGPDGTFGFPAEPPHRRDRPAGPLAALARSCGMRAHRCLGYQPILASQVARSVTVA